MIAAHGGDAPVILRICHSPAAAALAGTWEPPRSVSQLLGGVLRRMRAARVRRRHVWLAGFDAHRPYPWGERASALAAYGATYGLWGSLPPSYARAAPRAPAAPPWVDDTDCPVCLAAYADAWPSPTPTSRAPSGRWNCSHAVCRECDHTIQNAPRSTRCPLCRATRLVFMQP